jgi:molybdenum cofactor biosynthesis protein MoaC
MRDVSSKYNTLRTAKASTELKLSKATIRAIKTGNVPKADPLGVARIAGIQAAKNTSLIIPYCHQVPLDWVNVEITLDSNSIRISTEVRAIWKTGVEMEALVAASASALTLYDMLKPIDEMMEILSVKLLEKKGGKSQMKLDGKGLTAAVLVMSDSVSAGKAKDTSGKFLLEKLKSFKFQVSRFKVVPDEQRIIEKELLELADKKKVDMIITTGGTGTGPRDVTPEATLSVIERRLDGVEETLRDYGQDRLPMAMLTRGVVGIRGKTLIINLPGSRRAVEDGMNVLFPAILHVFIMMKGVRH